MPEFVCIGMPYFLGELVPGRTEVAAIKASGLAAELGAPWVDVPLTVQPGEKPIAAANRALAEAIRAYPDRLPLIFAADCTSAVGAMGGLANKNPGILWYDAHGDFNTPETSPSGFLGGMPLAMLVGRGDQWLMDAAGAIPVAEERVILTDARDLDPAEGEALKASQVTHLRHVTQTMAHPLPTGYPLYVHLDTDIVDAGEMPGMLYPTTHGPSVQDVAMSLTHVAFTAPIAGLMVTLWSGALVDDDAVPLANTLHLVRAFIAGLAD